MKYPRTKPTRRNQSSQFNYSRPSSRPTSIVSDNQVTEMQMQNGGDEPEVALQPIPSAQEELRLVTELSKCRVCLRVFTDPVTLSCGNTVCHHCLPPFDPHTVWKFVCPIPNCNKKSHLFGDIKVDVAIHNLTDIIQKENALKLNQGQDQEPAPLPPLFVDSDDESIVDNVEDKPWNVSESPSMAFLESDLWSDVESVTSSLPGAYDPSNMSAAESVSSLPTSCSTAATDIPFKDHMLDELECQICYLLYYEPITTPCGHTFCKNCILRSIDHTDRCPLCRHKLPNYTFFHSHPINFVLHNIITTMFGQLWRDRRMMAEEELYSTMDFVPIFVCSLAFPKMPLPLHIFEPRYRLMLRRCMESKNQRFGMVLPCRNGGSHKEHGTMLEITNVNILPDGRAIVETVGTFRFRVVEWGMKDGYNTGKVERIEDVTVEEEVELERADLDLNNAASQPKRTSELILQARLFVEQLRTVSAPLLNQGVNTFGNVPEDDTDFSWWIASVLPIDEYEKYRLLEITSTRQRMKTIVVWISQLQEQWWFSRGDCLVM